MDAVPTTVSIQSMPLSHAVTASYEKLGSRALSTGDVLCYWVDVKRGFTEGYNPPVVVEPTVVLQALNISRYFAFAGATIAIYDWLLLLEEERKLLGGARLSLGKALYYLARITTIPGLIYAAYTLSPLRPNLNQTVIVWRLVTCIMNVLTYTSCVTFLWLSPIQCLSSIFISYWLLTLRVAVLYQRNPLVKSVLYFSLGACYLTAFGVLLSCQYNLSKMDTYIEQVDICVPAELSSYIQVVFEAPLVFEAIMFAALIYRAWDDLKSRGSLGTLPLLRVLYRDGILFFVIMTATRIWNIYKYAERPVYETLEGPYIMWSIVSVLSCRIYLNIARAAQGLQERGKTSQWTTARGQEYSLWEFTPSGGLDSNIDVWEGDVLSLRRNLNS